MTSARYYGTIKCVKVRAFNPTTIVPSLVKILRLTLFNIFNVDSESFLSDASVPEANNIEGRQEKDLHHPEVPQIRHGH